MKMVMVLTKVVLQAVVVDVMVQVVDVVMVCEVVKVW